LDELGGLPGIHRASYAEVCEQHGIGPAKAAQIKAAIELGRRLNSIDPEERPTINSPDDAAAFVQYEMSALEQEELWVLLLDSRNRIVYLDKRYRGSLNSSQVRVGEIFNEAVKRNSASIIVIHNHPSGDPTPSTDDIKLTRLIIEAGKLLDIEVLDHLVIGGVRNVSLKKRGLGFG
jgi:DNA repair protein RadC